MKLNKFKYALYFLLSLCLCACHEIALLTPKGPIAADEKKILITAVFLMLTVVVPVIIMSLFFAWKYRESNKKATYTPNWAHSTTLEVVVWTIPFIIIAILATIAWKKTHSLDPYRPLKHNTSPLAIQVVALDWKWLFIYPKQNIATVNFIQIPVNVPIEFSITADAPMNSFQIPQLAGQIYAMAGMRTKLNLIANETGDYRGMSTNYSGDGFSGMMFTVRASSEKDFQHWVNTVKKSSHQLTMQNYNTLAKPSKNNQPEYFSLPTTENGLFNKIMMKFMIPTPTFVANKNNQ